MAHNILTAVLVSRRSYALLSLTGMVLLTWLHWNHSWPELSQSRVFTDLGDSKQADPLNEAIQAAILAGLFGLYLFCLANWERMRFTVREIAGIGIAQWLAGGAALPANSTDILGYISLGRLAGIYGVNPYLHTYAEFHDAYSHYIEWHITMPFDVVFRFLCLALLAALRISIAHLIPLVFVTRALIAETGKPKLTQAEA
ncbi:MAG TPA: hypothetical protein VGB07_03755 [Blastocatellia bacterium]|jgi:hypothetical protein